MGTSEEGQQTEKDNVELRKEMLRYNLITDHDDKYTLVKALFTATVVVPTVPNDDPDGMPLFGSMFKHSNSVELHVFTSAGSIPESNASPDVVYYPFAELMDDILADGEVTMVRIDPGTDHGVGIMIKDGQPHLFRQKRVEDYMREQGMEFLE